jgi:hypothetical protein
MWSSTVTLVHKNCPFEATFIMMTNLCFAQDLPDTVIGAATLTVIVMVILDFSMVLQWSCSAVPVVPKLSIF